MKLEQLDERLLELLVFLSFEPWPLSQVDMLGKLGTGWNKTRLQQALATLVEAGWLERPSGRWGVPARRLELVARYASRRQLLGRLPSLETKALDARLPLSKQQRDYLTCQLRRALFGGDEAAFRAWANYLPGSEFQVHPFDQFWSPFDPEWLDELRPGIRRQLINHRLETDKQQPSELAYLEAVMLKEPDTYSDKARLQLAYQALLAGRIAVGERLAESVEHPAGRACLAFAQLQRGNAQRAADEYRVARAALRKLIGKRKVGFSEPFGWLEALALIELGDKAELTRYLELESPCRPILSLLAEQAQGKSQARQLPTWKRGYGLAGLLLALLHSWCQSSSEGWAEEVNDLQKRGQLWLAAEFASLLGLQHESWRHKAEQLHARLGTRPLLQVCSPPAEWERTLDALAQLVPAREAKPQPQHNRRLVWQVNVYDKGDSLSLEPLEQSNSKGKGWTSGRPVALKRLRDEHESMAHLTSADRGICRCIETRRVGYYGQEEIRIDVNLAIFSLMDHPLVIARKTGKPLQVCAVRPRLVITPQGPNWHLHLECPARFSIAGDRLNVLLLNACERGLQSALGEGLVVPPAGQARLYSILSALSNSFVGDLPPDPDRQLSEDLKRALGGNGA